MLPNFSGFKIFAKNKNLTKYNEIKGFYISENLVVFTIRNGSNPMFEPTGNRASHKISDFVEKGGTV